MVSIFTYQDQTSLNWFKSIENILPRFDHLSVTHLSVLDGQNIEEIVERGMNFNISIEDDEIWLSNEKDRINIGVSSVKKPSL